MRGRLALSLCGIVFPLTVLAQSALLDVDRNTSIRRVTFSYVDADQYKPRFTVQQLRELTATRAVPRQQWVRRLLGRDAPGSYRLNPIELQRDVVRLRQAFQEAGYLHTYIDYGTSTLDTSTNTISIQFHITQGPPVIIQDVGFYSDSGYLAASLDSALRAEWIDFRDQTSFDVGDVFTYFEMVQIEDKVLNWFKNRGYAFASLETSFTVDSTYNAADINFQMGTGPKAHIAGIQIVGAPSVNRQILLRMLPFRTGDVFSQQDLIEAQRVLFALGLFSVVQVEAVPHTHAASVEVHVNLERARPRHISAETGYHQRQGLIGEGRWTHRNFLNGARTLTLTAQIQTGLLATAGIRSVTGRSARAGIALTQPYLGMRELRGILEPFIQYERDPLAGESSKVFDFNRREYGVTTTLIYGLRQNRVLSLRYSLSRTTTFTDNLAGDAYDKSVLWLGGTLGWTDNFLRPTRGVIVQPRIEQGGRIESWLGARPFGVNYFKMQIQVATFLPMSANIQLSGRFKAGRVWPETIGHRILYSAEGVHTVDTQFLQPVEDRFDLLRYYIGGADDVRGWSTGLAGPKAIRTEDTAVEERNPVYEPIGGLARLAASVEAQFRLSGPWYAAVFADAGAVSSARVDNCRDEFFEDPARTHHISVQCGFRDTGRILLRQFKVGTGLGIRYDTPIGFIRLDLATKVNPDPLDLRAPVTQTEYSQRNTWYRFNVHFSIGQAF